MTPRAAPAAYANGLEQRIATHVSDILDVARVAPDDDFFALGGGSLHAAELFGAIARDTGLDLPLALLVEAPTVRRLAAAVAAYRPAPWPLVVPLRPAGSRIPVVVVHGGLGNVLAARSLADHLGEGVPLYAIQWEGLDGSLPGVRDVEQMADRYLDELCRCGVEPPFLLFGFSFGGLVAYEMARRLEAGRPDAAPLLCLGDTAVPADDPVTRTSMTAAARIAIHRRNLRERSSGDRAGYLLERLRQRAHEVELRVRSALGRRIPPRLRPAHALRLNAAAAAKYRPSPYSGRVVLFRARDSGPPGDLGWGELVPRLEVVDIGGWHSQLLAAPAVGHIAARMNEETARVR